MLRRCHYGILVGILLPVQIFAADFVTVYRDAVACDPKFKAAIAEFEAIKQDIPINVAAFLPQVTLNGSLAQQNSTNQTNIGFVDNGSFNNDIVDYNLTINQSIFNYANFARLAGASATVKQAAANLNAAAQDLIIRTSAAYFKVLNASEDLRFTRAEKAAIKRELDQNTERYRVGLIAVTAVYDAQASYDAVVAREIASLNNFADRIEELREITGKSYATLMGVGENIPLAKPNPADIDKWVSKAGKYNYTLAAAHFASIAAFENIKVQFSGHLPTVEGSAVFDYNYQTDFEGVGYQKNRTSTLQLTGQLPVYSGGAVVAHTAQARYSYLQATANEEAVRRSVVSQTRQAYMGVISGINQVRADKQAIISRSNELDATKAAYDVGTRTMVDVLRSQSDLYDTQRITVRDQYLYLAETLLLKQQAGTLNPCDVFQMNRIFTKSAKMVSYRDVNVVEISGHKIPDQLSDKELSKTPDSPDANSAAKASKEQPPVPATAEPAQPVKPDTKPAQPEPEPETDQDTDSEN